MLSTHVFNKRHTLVCTSLLHPSILNYFGMNIYVVGAHQNRLSKLILMNSNKKYCLAEIRKLETEIHIYELQRLLSVVQTRHFSTCFIKYFSYFCKKTYLVGTHQNRLSETSVMSHHNSCFQAKLRKVAPELPVCFEMAFRDWSYKYYSASF